MKTHGRLVALLVPITVPLAIACGGDGTGATDEGIADAVTTDKGLDLAADPGTGIDVPNPQDAGQEMTPADVPGDAELPHTDEGGGDVPVETGPCTPKQPLSEWTDFTVSGLETIDQEDTSITGVFEEAVVTAIRYTAPSGAKNQDVTFTLKGRAGTVVVNSALPDNYEIPVAVGQTVFLFGRHEQGFEHRNLVFVVWEALVGGGTGNPLFFLHDAARTGDPPWHECEKLNPCPSAVQVYTECPPAPVECGAATYPPVELRMHGGMSSGEAVKPLDQGTTVVGFDGHRYMNIRTCHFTDIFCMDMPGDWTSAVIGKSEYASQCECHDSADCAVHEVCEPGARRCVPDLCRPEALEAAGKNCKEGYICDPFKGTCKQPIPPPDPCGAVGDCGLDHVCNPEMRFCQDKNSCGQVMGGCVPNPCVVMDCLDGCNALLGTCTQCLADCECAHMLKGDFCDETYTCQPCDVQKIGFGQQNPAMFELYHLCVWQNGVDPEIQLQEIDPSINCVDGGGGPAGCDGASERSCSGTLEYIPGTKWITDDKWGRLCALSQQAWVPKVAGGHYL